MVFVTIDVQLYFFFGNIHFLADPQEGEKSMISWIPVKYFFVLRFLYFLF